MFKRLPQIIKNKKHCFAVNI